MRLFLLCAGLIVGCSNPNQPDPDADQITLRGGVEKGPFVLGSSVTVSPVDAAGNPSGQVFNTQTENDLGEFDVAFSYTGPVALEAEGFYYNEVTGQLSGAPLTLRAFYDVQAAGTQSAYINLITHLTAGRVQSLLEGGATLAASVDTAESELRSELQIGVAGFDPQAAGTELSIAAGDSAANAYLLLVSAVFAQAAVDAVGTSGSVDATLQELINNVAVDLRADGTLEASVVAQLAAAEANLDVDQVTSDLLARLAATNSSAVAPNLAQVTDLDGDGTADATDDDVDGDGSLAGSDCDDEDPFSFPGATEIWYDGIDQDCSGGSDFDQDGDGEDTEQNGGSDCNDEDSAINTAAVEIWYDGTDQDCDGASDFDQDADGHDSEAEGVGDDCDDLNPAISPSEPEIWYDDINQNCDGASDFDQDGDGEDSDEHSGTDCDDEDSAINTAADEIWYDDTDQDCSGGSDFDKDGDGEDSDQHAGPDCNDEDAAIHTAAVELCDGIDNDCDGPVDGADDGLTDVIGGIGTATWDLAGSPYCLSGVAFVGSADTLTVDPDVEVYGRDFELQVFGTLFVDATPSTPALFDGVSVIASGINAGSPHLLDIHGAVFEGGQLYPAGSSGVGSLILEDSLLMGTSLIYLWYPSGDCSISRTVFLGTEDLSIGVSGVKVTLTNNHFEDWIPGQAVGVWNAAPGDVTLTANTFADAGRVAVSTAPPGGGTGAIGAVGNYWGSTDPVDIEAMIYDVDDNPAAQFDVDASAPLAAADPSTPTPADWASWIP